MVLSDEYIKTILKSKIDNKTTLDTYLSKMNSLGDKLKKPIYDILKNPATNYPLMQNIVKSETTLKNYVTMLLSIFKNVDELRSKKQSSYEEWKGIHEDLRQKEEFRYKQNKPSDKQLENYLSFHEIEEMYSKLSRNDPHKTKQSSLEYLLLSLTLNLRPKRCDFGNVALLQKGARHSPTGNYIILDKPTNSYVVLTEYKTSQTYETIKERIPKQMYNDVIDSVAKHPRKFLFIDRYNNAYTDGRAYSAFVIRTFEKLFNKRVGVSMLRHIYVREKLDFNNMSQAELDEEARLMTHSADLQRLYRWIIKDNDLERCACVKKN
jgi:hypothetical protein